MFAFITTLLITTAIMWVFFKFMYPKPPKHLFPQEGDVISPRLCDECGYPLAQYRGVIEPISEQPPTHQPPHQPKADTANAKKLRQQRELAIKKGNSKEIAELDELIAQWECQWFFCNYEHQAQFHQRHQKHPTLQQTNQSSTDNQCGKMD